MTFLLALFGGGFVFANLVRLLNPPIPLRKHPADRWDWLCALLFWPSYAGMIFPTLSASVLLLLTGQLKGAGREALHMLDHLLSWSTLRPGRQAVTLACWLSWGYSMSGYFEPRIFWTLFAIAPIVWLFVGLALFMLFLYIKFEILSGPRQLNHA